MNPDEKYFICPKLHNSIGYPDGFTVADLRKEKYEGERAGDRWREEHDCDINDNDIDVRCCEISFMHKRCYVVCFLWMLYRYFLHTLYYVYNDLQDAKKRTQRKLTNLEKRFKKSGLKADIDPEQIELGNTIYEYFAADHYRKYLSAEDQKQMEDAEEEDVVSEPEEEEEEEPPKKRRKVVGRSKKRGKK